MGWVGGAPALRTSKLPPFHPIPGAACWRSLAYVLTPHPPSPLPHPPRPTPFRTQPQLRVHTAFQIYPWHRYGTWVRRGVRWTVDIFQPHREYTGYAAMADAERRGVGLGGRRWGGVGVASQRGRVWMYVADINANTVEWKRVGKAV